MKYYGNITFELQIILIKKWVRDFLNEKRIAEIIGEPIDPKLPTPLTIQEFLNCFKENNNYNREKNEIS